MENKRFSEIVAQYKLPSNLTKYVWWSNLKDIGDVNITCITKLIQKGMQSKLDELTRMRFMLPKEESELYVKSIKPVLELYRSNTQKIVRVLNSKKSKQQKPMLPLFRTKEVWKKYDHVVVYDYLSNKWISAIMAYPSVDGWQIVPLSVFLGDEDGFCFMEMAYGSSYGMSYKEYRWMKEADDVEYKQIFYKIGMEVAPYNCTLPFERFLKSFQKPNAVDKDFKQKVAKRLKDLRKETIDNPYLRNFIDGDAVGEKNAIPLEVN